MTQLRKAVLTGCLLSAKERIVETRHRNSQVGSVFPVAASLKCVAASDRPHIGAPNPRLHQGAEGLRPITPPYSRALCKTRYA
jgi:hypothetical protein